MSFKSSLKTFGAIAGILAVPSGIVISNYNAILSKKTIEAAADQQCRQNIEAAWKLIDEGRKCTTNLNPKEKELNDNKIIECYKYEKRGLENLESIVGNLNYSKDVNILALQNIITFYETAKNPQKFQNEIKGFREQINQLNNSK